MSTKAAEKKGEVEAEVVLGTTDVNEATTEYAKQTFPQADAEEIGERVQEWLTSETDPFIVHFFGTKANVKTLWDSSQVKIVRWRLQGKALVVYGYNQGLSWTSPEGNRNELQMWKMFLPANVCVISYERFHKSIHYRTYYDEQPGLVAHFPMWLKELRVYPCRKAVVEGYEADKNESSAATAGAPPSTALHANEVREGKVPELTVKVLSLGRVRTNSYGRVCEASCEDDSGRIKVTLWNDDIENVQKDDVIIIKDGYAKTYKGVLSVSAGKYGTLEVQRKVE